MDFLEQSCRKHEIWKSENIWKYPNVPYLHITKYKAE